MGIRLQVLEGVCRSSSERAGGRWIHEGKLRVSRPHKRVCLIKLWSFCWWVCPHNEWFFSEFLHVAGASSFTSSVFRLLCVERAMAQAHVVPRRVGPCHVMVEPQHFPAAVLSSKAASPASTQQDLDSLVVLGLDSQTLAPGRPYILNFLNIPN